MGATSDHVRGGVARPARRLRGDGRRTQARWTRRSSMPRRSPTASWTPRPASRRWSVRARTAATSIALFDATDPRALKALGTIDDGLGAVERYRDRKRHVFAVSDARRLDVVSIEDPARPRACRLAGLGRSRVRIGRHRRPATSRWRTASRTSRSAGPAWRSSMSATASSADRRRSRRASAGSMRRSRPRTRRTAIGAEPASGTRSRARISTAARDIDAAQPGFARIIDFTDPARPEEVARYEVPEAGVQDLWIDGERLYVAAQNGGVRVVDISARPQGQPVPPGPRDRAVRSGRRRCRRCLTSSRSSRSTAR